eukprot:TRINITY_DN6040_c0_g1_i1.p1 TRINITY_DN6040_c0_g1~~TRINITY_DN6040_c0_g1_i1.p1  ORF type:complete len:251 (-),score=43.58 TRINITY_DN6040_c0_g1_i1:70-822(-)
MFSFGSSAQAAPRRAIINYRRQAKKKSFRSFSTFIYKVLKQIHPSLGISNKAMSVMNSLVQEMLSRVFQEIKLLADYNNRLTISVREVRTAVQLLFPGELAKHAVSELTKSVTKYNADFSSNRFGGATAMAFPGSAPADLKVGKVTPSMTRSGRSGLVFPVGRIHRLLKEYFAGYRVGAGAPVSLAAALEYICAEVLELGGNASRDLRMKRITPRHLTLGIRGDEELDKLFSGTISSGGVIPHIHMALVR